MFIPCYFGNEIKCNSQDFLTALHGTNWLTVDKSTKKSLLILIENLRRPIKVRAAKLFDVDLEIFLFVVNSAYSLFAILKQI